MDDLLVALTKTSKNIVRENKRIVKGSVTATNLVPVSKSNLLDAKIAAIPSPGKLESVEIVLGQLYFSLSLYATLQKGTISM